MPRDSPHPLMMMEKQNRSTTPIYQMWYSGFCMHILFLVIRDGNTDVDVQFIISGFKYFTLYVIIQRFRWATFSKQSLSHKDQYHRQQNKQRHMRRHRSKFHWQCTPTLMRWEISRINKAKCMHFDRLLPCIVDGLTGQVGNQMWHNWCKSHQCWLHHWK